MIALLGSLLGFGSSFLPEILNFFKANQQQKHRMAMMRLETELAQQRAEMKLVELDKRADIEETKGLYEHDRSIDAGVIMIKVGQAGGDWMQAVELMFDPETQGLFSAVLAFWFGNRAISKYAGK